MHNPDVNTPEYRAETESAFRALRAAVVERLERESEARRRGEIPAAAKSDPATWQEIEF